MHSRELVCGRRRRKTESEGGGGGIFISPSPHSPKRKKELGKRGGGIIGREGGEKGQKNKSEKGSSTRMGWYSQCSGKVDKRRISFPRWRKRDGPSSHI